MTYRSRGRSVFEVVLAVMFVGFLVGFITVLCIGNYFRAKRAQERQRQRRVAKQAQAAQNTQMTNNGRPNIGDPISPRQQGFQGSVGGGVVGGYNTSEVVGEGGAVGDGNSAYEPPNSHGGVQA